MRLLIVSGIFHPEIGGPATYLHSLAHALHRRGDDVAVVAYGEPHPDGAYPFPVHRVSRSGNPITRLVRFSRTLARLSRGHRLWFVNDYGVPALLVSRLRRPAIVMKVVGDFAWEYSRRNGLTDDGIDPFQQRNYGWRIEGLKRLQRAYVRSAGRVIVPSQYLGGLVEGWGVPPERVRVIYNAVSLDDLDPTAVERPHGAGPILLTAGRLASWKGMPHVLEIFSRVRRQFPRAHLVVAGDGPMGDALRQQGTALGLDGAVTWLGGVPRDRLVAWMHASDLFLLLSEYEGFPHVAIEAMTTGLPVALSPAGGNPELVTDGQHGLVIDPATHDASADRVSALLGDAARLSELGARARQRAGDFTWPRLLDETLAVLAEVAPTEAADR